jgi:hypothetical protein
MPSPGLTQGAGTFSIDRAHGVIHAASWSLGLWRLRAR